MTVETDHQPLITILKKPLHTASAPIQRMMLCLQRYKLNVIYKRGRELYVADALSRAHLPSTDQAEEMEEYKVMVVDVLSSHRVEELKRETLADPVCRRLSEVVAAGWPNTFREVPRDLSRHERGTYSRQSAAPGRQCSGQPSTVILKDKFPGVPPVMLSSHTSLSSPFNYMTSLTYRGP